MTDTLEILDEVMLRVKKLEDQMGWILARQADTGDNPKIQKLEIQVNCLRKQVLDIEGKKSYTEEAQEYASMRSEETESDLEHEQDPNIQRLWNAIDKVEEMENNG